MYLKTQAKKTKNGDEEIYDYESVNIDASIMYKCFFSCLQVQEQFM